jgi:trehalose 6-phosphate synthase/phosphatase
MACIKQMPARRMIIVSNRLPFTIRKEDRGLNFIPSVGGLATGLSSYLESFRDHPSKSMDYLWLGWPGLTVPYENREEIESKSRLEFNALPVFLSEQDIESFYQGFCNKTIWPLFHYFPTYAIYDKDQWEHYVEVNRRFCQTLIEILKPDDAIWIHDYHLMLLPGMLREKSPTATIGFFLHIPFPNYEMFRLLPGKWSKRILEGLLGADLIGFHTNDYKQDFLRCVLRILGHDSNIGEILVGDRIVKAGTFPMGIDFSKFHEGASHSQAQQDKIEISGQLKEAKVVLSIDRLDYTKGIINRLEAFQCFLEACPHWHGRVTLLLIVVPSRVDIERYDSMKNQIERLVGMINGKFSNPGWTPVVYMFRALEFSSLVAVYSASDIALITPLRDGMNLIAKEYVAARTDKTGVLILSEMTGASKELTEARIINPNDRNEIVEALIEALKMPQNEQIRRITIMQERLQRHDVLHWVSDFMKELDKAKEIQNEYSPKIFSCFGRMKFFEDYCRSKRRLVLLDYDGTLAPYAIYPETASPDQDLLSTLNDLVADTKNEIVIVSGRQRDFLDKWLSGIGIGLVAEHGAWIKERNKEWKRMASVANNWKPRVLSLLEQFVNRVDGSFIEEKDFALVWHYRGADQEQGLIAAQELQDLLLALAANCHLQVLHGNKTVEIRIAGVTKATGSMPFLSSGDHDFIVAIGDDKTDEDLFEILPEKAYTLRVGLGLTHARYMISDVHETVQLLKEMALLRNALWREATVLS